MHAIIGHIQVNDQRQYIYIYIYIYIYNNGYTMPLGGRYIHLI